MKIVQDRRDREGQSVIDVVAAILFSKFEFLDTGSDGLALVNTKWLDFRFRVDTNN